MEQTKIPDKTMHFIINAMLYSTMGPTAHILSLMSNLNKDYELSKQIDDNFDMSLCGKLNNVFCLVEQKYPGFSFDSNTSTHLFRRKLSNFFLKFINPGAFIYKVLKYNYFCTDYYNAYIMVIKQMADLGLTGEQEDKVLNFVKNMPVIKVVSDYLYNTHDFFMTYQTTNNKFISQLLYLYFRIKYLNINNLKEKIK